MKQIGQNYKSGDISIQQVEVPACKPGGALVQTLFSVVSVGTEGMKAREGKMSYLAKAKARPDQVKKVIQSVQQQGLLSTYEKVMHKLDSLTPLGYSLAGIVTEVGREAGEFQVGQRVACAGAGVANHAEVNFVPKNLMVHVPDNVAMEHAAFTTIGSIAMQGFRQSEMQLGETACVIGLGLIGQLLVQILGAAGIQVIGIDLMDERCRLAESLGATACFTSTDSSLIPSINHMTQGIGVDCIFIAAGGKSRVPIELAATIARDRGRIVDIGKTNLDLPWNEYYEKELDVRFSRSYGPGRYDPNYENRGIDYPVGYVRWTEKRNMTEFLNLISKEKVLLDPIISETCLFDDAESVYQKITDASTPVLGVVFKHNGEYKHQQDYVAKIVNANSNVRPLNAEKVRLGVIGAGNYASSMLLPHLHKSSAVCLKEVATTTGLSAKNADNKFSFERVSTHYQSMLTAKDIDAVMIATPHHCHTALAVEALSHNKIVYVEKPLAIDIDGLNTVTKAITESGNNRLMVGFNRRFSPSVQEIKKTLEHNRLPMTIHYRVNAGQIDKGSWYLDSQDQGSRFIGEAGHFFDVFAFITEARPISVMAKCLRPSSVSKDDLNNIIVLVDYDDGSLANLIYVTQGGTKLPKEFVEVFCGGTAIQLHDFEKVMVFEDTHHKTLKFGHHDKGQKEELKQFIDAANRGTAMPISISDIVDTTLVTLAAEESLRTGEKVKIAELIST